MTEAERKIVLGLQGQAYEVWSQLRALNKLMDHAEEEHGREEGAPAANCSWDDDLIAASQIIGGLERKAERLAHLLEGTMIEREAKGAA